MADLESVRDIIRRLWGFPQRKGDDPLPRCKCGNEFAPDSWYCWLFDVGLTTMDGLTCSRPGCAGNIKERHQAEADAIINGTPNFDGIDREFLRSMKIEI
jgi:hypothetical protein